MPGIEGRVTMVTGAGRGIGYMTAKLLSSRSTRVMAVARSENELKSPGLDYCVAGYAGSAYNSSKHDLPGLMRSVAQDAGTYGVRPNAVLPGWVKIPMADASALAEVRERGISVGQVREERA